MEPSDAALAFVVLAGTYERILYGLNAFVWKKLKMAHSTARWNQCSTDETIKVYDLRSKREIGSLGHHKDAVTQLAYFRSEHLITAGEDGDIAIIRTHDWTVLKTLTGHKGPVTGLAVHPTGKLALSVGKDRLLKCWNLATGTCAYASKLKTTAAPDRVRWGTGDSIVYAVGADRTVELFRVDGGDDSATLEGVGRINSFEFVSLKRESDEADSERIVTGGEDRMITVWDLKGKPLARWNSGYASRIKDLSVISISTDDSSTATVLLITCSSDGAIRVWDLASCVEKSPLPESSEATPNPATTISANTNISLDPIGEYNCDARVTCLTSTIVAYRKKDAPTERSNAKRTINDVEADDLDEFETDVGGDDEEAPVGSNPVATVSIGDIDSEEIESTSRGSKQKKLTKRKDNGSYGKGRGRFKHRRGDSAGGKRKAFGGGGKRQQNN
ncbi:WD40-repeat-containing domain protein [Cladochytrium replicatum]|nr:WD40-repeat-containing domain protein [Cladochytrium replicatum]